MFTPPLIPSIPPVRPAPLLTSERLRAELEACGYRCTDAQTVEVTRRCGMVPGGSVVLQFSDASTMDNGRWLMIPCSVQINGSCELATSVTRWQSRKTFSFLSARGTETSGFVLEMEVMLGADLVLGDVLTHGDHVFRQLQLLIADACDLLRDTAIETGLADAVVPMVRIEAKVFGELVAGRSGLVGRGKDVSVLPPSAAVRRLQLLRKVCDRLKDDVVPELAMAIGRMTRAVEHACADQHLRPPAWAPGWADRDTEPSNRGAIVIVGPHRGSSS